MRSRKLDSSGSKQKNWWKIVKTNEILGFIKREGYFYELG